MPVSVSMPQLGESVTEGTVTRWLKKEGERVEADEPLLEVSTDKVDTEIPSPVSGILRGITVAEDETVAVGAELAVIDETADTETAPPVPAAPEQAAPPAPPVPAAVDGPGAGGQGPAYPGPTGPAFPPAGVAVGYPPAETAPPGAAPRVPAPAAATPVQPPTGPPAAAGAAHRADATAGRAARNGTAAPAPAWRLRQPRLHRHRHRHHRRRPWHQPRRQRRLPHRVRRHWPRPGRRAAAPAAAVAVPPLSADGPVCHPAGAQAGCRAWGQPGDGGRHRRRRADPEAGRAGSRAGAA